MSHPQIKQFPLLIIRTITNILSEAYPCPRAIDAPLAERGLGNYAHKMRALTVEEAEAVRPIWSGAQVGDLILATRDACGAVVGARLWTQEGRRFAPRADSGLATTGGILADYAAQNWLQGAHPPRCLWIAEGEPDFVSLSMCAEKLRPSLMREDQKRGAFYPGDMVGVLGIYSGAWSAEMGARCGEVAEVYICTHLDPAGERYAAEIRASIPEGVTVKRWVGGSVEGEDVNDMVRRGVDAWSLTSAVVSGPVMPPPPTSDAGRWAWSDASGEWSELESWAAARAKEKAWAAARSMPRAALGDALLERAKQWAEGKLVGVCAELQGLDGNRGRALAIMAPVMSLVAGGALDGGLVEGALTRAYVSGDRKTKADRALQIKTAFKSGPRGQVREPLTLEDIAAKLAAEDDEKHRGAGCYSPAPSPATLAPKGEDGTSAAVSGAQEEGTKGLLTFDADGVAHVDSRYLPRDLVGDVWRTVTIKSDQGSGKTEALFDLIKRSIQKRMRVVVIVHRQDLARYLAERLGAVCYLDTRGRSFIVGKSEAFIVCVNSLSHFLLDYRGENTAPDLVIIDESEQVGNHLFGKTIGDGLLSVSKKLKKMLKNAKQVVCADADAGPITEKIIHWSGRDPGFLIQNDFHKWCFNVDGSNIVHVLKDRTNAGRLKAAKMFCDAVKEIKLGDAPVVAACVSKGQTDELAHKMADKLALELAAENGLDSVKAAAEAGLCIVIHSRNKDEEHVKAFLADINGSMRKYRAVIYSPTLGTGVSIDAEEVSQVFGFGKAVEGFTGQDFVQLITRARKHQKPALLWLDGRTFGRLPRDEEAAHAQAMRLLDVAARIVEDTDLAECVRDVFRTEVLEKAHNGETGSLFSLGVTVAAETGRKGWNPAASALETLRARGAVVVEIDGDHIDKPSEQAKATHLKQQAQEEEVKAILAAPQLSDAELEDTRQQSTQEAVAAVRRANIERTLGEDITEAAARAEVTRGALYCGELLALMGALADGGDAARHLAGVERSILSAAPAAIFDSKRRLLPMAAHLLEVLRLAGFDGIALNEGRGVQRVRVGGEALDRVRAYLCANREILSDLHIAPYQKMTPPEGEDDKTKSVQQGLTRKWINDKLGRWGFVNDALVWIRRDIKRILDGRTPEDARADVVACLAEHQEAITSAGLWHIDPLKTVRELLKSPKPLRVSKKVNKQRTYILDVSAVAAAWRWARRPLAEITAEATAEAAA